MRIDKIEHIQKRIKMTAHNRVFMRYLQIDGFEGEATYSLYFDNDYVLIGLGGLSISGTTEYEVFCEVIYKNYALVEGYAPVDTLQWYFNGGNDLSQRIYKFSAPLLIKAKEELKVNVKGNGINIPIHLIFAGFIIYKKPKIQNIPKIMNIVIPANALKTEAYIPYEFKVKHIYMHQYGIAGPTQFNFNILDTFENRDIFYGYTPNLNEELYIKFEPTYELKAGNKIIVNVESSSTTPRSIILSGHIPICGGIE